MTRFWDAASGVLIGRFMDDLELYYREAWNLELRYGDDNLLGSLGSDSFELQADIEEETGPVLIPAAPSFPGMAFAQFIPANLYLGGDLGLNEPIDSLPLYGDLIPGGAFTASGTARPILQEVEGRLGAYHNGFRTLEIDGLELDLTGGHLFFCVKKDESTGNFQGCARFQLNESPDTTTNSVFEFYNAAGGQYAVTNRASAPLVAGVAQRPRNSFFSLGANAPDPEYLNRGVYVDGVRETTFGFNTAKISGIVTKIQVAGYNRVQFRGNLETWGVIAGQPNASQREQLRDYLRIYFNDGEPFDEEPEP